MTFKMQKFFGVLLFVVFSTTAGMAQVEQREVTDDELSKFADTFQKMRMMNQEAQVKMTEVVTDEDMEIKRFNEIHQATLDPAVEVTVTEEEQEKYDNIVSEIEEMQVEFQEKMEETIRDGGLTVQRYQEIVTDLERDPELQERLRAEFNNDDN